MPTCRRTFETIPHPELMQSMARRIVDRAMLTLIKGWLKGAVEERDEQGRPRLTGGKHSKAGTPQGGVISPLLANIYMNRFLRAWRQRGKAAQYRAKLIAYADDFVILSRGKAEQALEWTRGVMGKLGLTLNEAKTGIRRASRERFNFLGDHVRADGVSEDRTPVSRGAAIEGSDRGGEGAGAGDPAPRESGAVAGSGEADQPGDRGMGELLRVRESVAGVPGRRGVRGGTGAALSAAATQADRAGITALFEATDLRGTGGPDAGSAERDALCVSPGVKPVGEPDAANPHVRFDERSRETE